MERLTDAAQGYCEVCCKEYSHCFGDPGDCIFQKEVAMYERLKDYEGTFLTPLDVKKLKTEIREMRRRLERILAAAMP